MFLEGAPRLLDAGVSVPGLHAGDPARIALEAYPGLAVRALTRQPYKNDAKGKQTSAQRAARSDIVSALRAGRPLAIRLRCSSTLDRALIEDASGDSLDAAICALQAAWAHARQASGLGLPAAIDPVEGWIVTA
jgi:predicted RNase H-like nuclease